MMLGSKTFALTVTRKNPFQIGCADRIFAFYSKFSYGQRSKCADLLNSYFYSFSAFRMQRSFGLRTCIFLLRKE